jgi:hypothetical protein
MGFFRSVDTFLKKGVFFGSDSGSKQKEASTHLEYVEAGDLRW